MTNPNPIRVYVDTSVVGGAFDEEFGRLSKPFWDAVKQCKIVIIASDVLGDEVEKAPKIVRDFFESLQKTDEVGKV